MHLIRPAVARSLALAATMVAVSIGTAACEPTPPAPAPDTYVALGDSAAAGPLILPTIAPLGCLKSNRDYPHLVAPAIRTARLIDVTCSGAETRHLTSPQSLPDGSSVPPQLDAVDARTKVVTMTMGGNDIAITEIATTCLKQMSMFQTCQSAYVRDGHDGISDRIEALGPRLDAALAAIRSRAPKAKVFVVGYIPLLDRNGTPCPTMPVWPSDGRWMRSKYDEINAKVHDRARAAGATYVGVPEGHDACQGTGARWVEGLVPLVDAAPLHPNAIGMDGLAREAVTAINAQVTS